MVEVHFLEGCSHLVSTLMQRLLSSDVVLCDELHKQDIKSKQLPDDRLEIGHLTRKSLCKLSESKQKVCLKGMRDFLTTSVEYLQKKLPLNNVLVKSIRCLHPSNI